MPDTQQKSNKEDGEERKSIFTQMFSRPSRDDDYMADLKAQWADLATAGRVKFVLGALLGLFLFIGALVLAYLALSALIG